MNDMNVRNTQKKPLIILTGPTAVGKTKASIGLAKAIGGEIISADSMQVYRYMDIGTAKIRKEEMEGVNHFLIDVLDPSEDFHVVKFKQMAEEALKQIYKNGHIPIVAGGTGFYIQALLYGINFTDGGADSTYRQELTQFAAEYGAEALYRRLLEVDEASGKTIHANNVKRVIRALEFYHQTGGKISEHNEKEKKRDSPYDFSYFVLNDLRERLYTRIDCRVDEMISGGLVEEVARLKSMGYTKDFTSMQGIGYKEILSYLDGECTFAEAVYAIKRDTRHFAKRQLTWFKRERQVTWIEKPEYNYDEERILYAMLLYLKGVPCLKNYSGDPDF